MDVLLADPALTSAGLPRSSLRRAAAAELDALRESDSAAPDTGVIVRAILRRALAERQVSLTRVVNATGVVLHPSLGRAPLCESATQAMTGASGYCALEYDVDTGRRATARAGAVEALLRDLTGAGGALVVNNNAAAVYLALTALAAGKGVALSRGELVEIGGGFRMTDIMLHSGCTLVEVGATNRTCQADYRAALEHGGVQFLLKVHTSNFKMTGYTQETSLAELVGLGRAYGFPVLYDLGSGPLLPARRLGLCVDCPSVSEAVHSGADLVCFSGDKLLGGPQTGILLGRSWAIEAIKKHPLVRALRPGKAALAALEATLRLYRDPEEARRTIPVLAMLSASPEELRARAEKLCARLERACGKLCAVAVEEGTGEAGGGALPGAELPTALVSLSPAGQTAGDLAAALRLCDTPVVALLRQDRVLLDVRTLRPGDSALLIQALKSALSRSSFS